MKKGKIIDLEAYESGIVESARSGAEPDCHRDR